MIDTKNGALTPDNTESTNEAIHDAEIEAPDANKEQLDFAADDTQEETQENNSYDYIEDMETLAEEFPELRGREITELENPMRYAALRDLGLTPREAYLATSGIRIQRDNRSHLGSAVPRGASRPSSKITASELKAARELFDGISDAQIIQLYKRVTN